MAVTAQAYGNAGYYAMSGAWSWTSNTINTGLFTSTYVPDIDAHKFLSDLSNELAGGGYGRQALTSKTLTYDATSNATQASAGAITFPSFTGTFRYLIFWSDTGTPTTSPLLFYIDYGVDVVVTAGSLTVPVPAAGYLTMTV
jgi:hypothetical protein